MPTVLLILSVLGMLGWFLYGKSVGEVDKRVKLDAMPAPDPKTVLNGTHTLRKLEV